MVDLVPCFFFFEVWGGAEEFEDVARSEFQAVEEGDEGEAAHVRDVLAGLSRGQQIRHAGGKVLRVEFTDRDGILTLLSLLQDGLEAADVVSEDAEDVLVAGAAG